MLSRGMRNGNRRPGLVQGSSPVFWSQWPSGEENAYMESNTEAASSYHHFTMSDGDFRRFSAFIYRECGINLPPAKKTMLTARLSKRLRERGMSSFREYFNYIRNSADRSKELVRMIDVVTTNKTDFFREPGHFEYLTNTVLPELLENERRLSSRRINVWSAGCSSGEEPYTLAMVLSEFRERHRKSTFSILATDISSRVLALARRAIYPERVVQSIPQRLRSKYLMKGKGSREGFFRIVPELRDQVRFKRLNLIEGADFGIRSSMDIVFCRNVIIYFDQETQKGLFEKIYNQLGHGGYLFIGHSETLHGVNNQLVPVGSAVYRKIDNERA